MRRLEFEAKSLDDAMNVAIEEFRVSKKYITLNVLDEKKGFLKPTSYRVEALFEANIKDVICDYISSVMEAMDVEYSLDISNNDNSFTFKLETDNNPLLIGREGKTLGAMQFLIKQLTYIYDMEHVNVSVDVGGYKDTRILQLEILATKTAKEVARTKISAKLTPMNSYERRIIHSKLSEWRDVITESTGDEPNRCLVIKPRDK